MTASGCHVKRDGTVQIAYGRSRRGPAIGHLTRAGGGWLVDGLNGGEVFPRQYEACVALCAALRSLR